MDSTETSQDFGDSVFNSFGILSPPPAVTVANTEARSVEDFFQIWDGNLVLSFETGTDKRRQGAAEFVVRSGVLYFS